MFEIFVTVDEHQHFKSFIRQMASFKLEHSPSNAENWLFLLIPDYDRLQASIALRSF